MHTHPITPSPVHPNPKVYVLFPTHVSVDIKVHHHLETPSLMLILSLNRSLSRLIPTLLTLSLGATLAAYPIPLTILTGNGTSLALSTSLSKPECMTRRSLSIGIERILIVLVVTGGGGDCLAVE
jgi:hypothetical protein